MQEEKTREQLLEENARLRALLAQVREAYALLEAVVRDWSGRCRPHRCHGGQQGGCEKAPEKILAPVRAGA